MKCYSWNFVFTFALVDTTVMLDAVRQVLEDPSFKIGTPEATEACDAAVRLLEWQQQADSNLPLPFHGRFVAI